MITLLDEHERYSGCFSDSKLTAVSVSTAASSQLVNVIISFSGKSFPRAMPPFRLTSSISPFELISPLGSGELSSFRRVKRLSYFVELRTLWFRFSSSPSELKRKSLMEQLTLCDNPTTCIMEKSEAAAHGGEKWVKISHN